MGLIKECLMGIVKQSKWSAIPINLSKSKISLNVFTKTVTKKLNVYLNLHY